MNKVGKIIFLLVLVFGITVLSYSYEDYYQKIYTVKVSKNDIFKAINATEKQQKNYQKYLMSIRKSRRSRKRINTV
ncbi:hypothetical protein [Leptotrichia alba]|uniref:Uncharacterized protein n=1 Tax=Leptotrichia alba TaxID=3239304 RepID=A0AB39V5P9_9FUSO